MNNALHDDLRSYPEEIRDLPFCNWRWEKRNGNDTKVPYDPVTGKRAQVNTPDTFTGSGHGGVYLLLFELSLLPYIAKVPKEVRGGVQP